ncbi:MAG: TIGR03545 family protein [Spirochaetales bacterium]|nr:TIGR03545 family protein [Spirochaetales bacterium]
MAKKPPKLFLKQYKETVFNKKILFRTFTEKDREYLLSVFHKSEENVYSIKQDLSREDIKQLHAIAKSIKKNTGVVTKGKLIVFLVIILSVSLFYILFKDILLADALKAGLTSIFQAKSEVAGLSFDIFNAKIALSSCAVGDSTKPLQNLVQLGKTEVDLNMTELLKGKFVVTNIECQDIQFGTKRTNSARLDGYVPPAEQKDREEAGEGFALDIKGVDTDAIINEQMENLKSPGQIKEINDTIKELTTRWSGTIETYEKDINKLGKSVDSVKKINIKNIKTIQDAQKAYSTIETVTKDLKKLKSVVDESTKEFGNDMEKVKTEAKLITESIANDYEFLLSFVKTPEKGVGKIFSSIAEDFLKNNLGDFYSYGMKGIDVIKNLDVEKKEKSEKDGKKKVIPGKGYKLQFPGKTYPNFLIENASFSIGDTAGTSFFKARVQDVSSSQELTGKPSSVNVIFKEGTRDISFDGFVDIRKASEEILSLSFSMNDYPLDVEKGLGLLGIEKLKADAAFFTDFAILRENKTCGSLSVSLKNITLELIDESNEISKNILQILTTADNVYINAGYSFREDGSLELSVESNIDKLIADRVGKMIEELAGEGKTRLKKELDFRLDSLLKENKALYTSFTDLESLLDGNTDDIKGFTSTIDKKRKEVEAKLKEIQKQAGEKAKDLIPDIDLNF